MTFVQDAIVKLLLRNFDFQPLLDKAIKKTPDKPYPGSWPESRCWPIGWAPIRSYFEYRRQACKN